MSDARRAPVGLMARGRRMWDDVTGAFDLSRAEVELLAEACRALDDVERLASLVRRARRDKDVTGELTCSRELRLQRTALGRLLAQLGIPDADDEAMLSPAQRQAQRAANTMWDNVRKLRQEADDA